MKNCNLNEKKWIIMIFFTFVISTKNSRKKARTKYRELTEEEKKILREKMDEIDAIIYLKKTRES